MEDQESGRSNRRTFLTGGIAAASLAVPLVAMAQVATDPPDTSVANKLDAMTGELEHVGGQLFRIDAELIDSPDTRVIDELERFGGVAAGIAAFAEDMLRGRPTAAWRPAHPLGRRRR